LSDAGRRTWVAWSSMERQIGACQPTPGENTRARLLVPGQFERLGILARFGSGSPCRIPPSLSMRQNFGKNAQTFFNASSDWETSTIPPNECRLGAAQVAAVRPIPPSRVTNDPGSNNTLIDANGHRLGKHGRVTAKKLRRKEAARDDLPNSSASGGRPAGQRRPAAVGATVPDARAIGEGVALPDGEGHSASPGRPGNGMV